ncbi:exopolysaccharide biosynthesis polyprenyl glycosylphosphotransferase [Streptomyces sp. NPDC051907]|uniref:exopolysaccharide biosynthesis polyprenyl glycosylphosphotransferase n=1 Tax=Streptomyces sp. NPDC051907 TaxID=3155284 RepID=UPI00343FC551
MTTESAHAPHPSQATAVQHRSAPSIHPPRGAAGRSAPLRPRDVGGRGPVIGLVVADTLAIGAAVALVPGVPRPELLFVLLAAVQPALHGCRGLYRASLSPSALAELPALLGLALIQWFAVTEVVAAYDSRSAIGWAALGSAVAVHALLACAARGAVFHGRRRRAARRPQSALIVGRGPVAHQLTAALYEHSGYGLRPVGRVDPGHPGAADPEPLPVLVTPEDVSRAVIQNSVRHAVFTGPPEAAPDTAALVELFSQHRCRLWTVDGGAAASDAHRRPQTAEHLWGFSVQPLNGGLHRPVARAAKRAMDALLAALALVATAPLMAVCALAVRLSDGPGVIFRQERIGLDGRPFTLLKFRTIAPVDEHESATRWSVALDQRMSVTGGLLRRSSLDELPQLWNVLRGDMSLVGPRPERPYFVAKFSRAHPGYQARHRMPVGITGLAQINGLRGDTSIEDRARFDNHYIDSWSPWQDVCILARTAASLFRLGGS